MAGTTGNFGQPTDILIDPYGDILMSSGPGQLAFIEVTGGAANSPPTPTTPGESIGIDFASPSTVFPDAAPATFPPAAGTNFNAFDTTVEDLATDGSGNLSITVTRSVQLFVAGLTITALEPVAPDCVLGDVNTDGAVDFFDISPFIAVLSSGGFQCEADTDALW